MRSGRVRQARRVVTECEKPSADIEPARGGVWTEPDEAMPASEP